MGTPGWNHAAVNSAGFAPATELPQHRASYLTADHLAGASAPRCQASFQLQQLWWPSYLPHPTATVLAQGSGQDEHLRHRRRDFTDCVCSVHRKQTLNPTAHWNKGDKIP